MVRATEMDGGAEAERGEMIERGEDMTVGRGWAWSAYCARCLFCLLLNSLRYYLSNASSLFIYVNTTVSLG